MDKPITIRALFGDEMFVSYHYSVRREENWRYQAREIADVAVTLGASWAQGWIAGQRVAWIVSSEFDRELGLTAPDDERRADAEQVWAAIESRTPQACTAPPAWQELAQTS